MPDAAASTNEERLRQDEGKQCIEMNASLEGDRIEMPTIVFKKPGIIQCSQIEYFAQNQEHNNY